MVATIQLSASFYEEQLLLMPEDSEDRKYPRVTHQNKYVENYKIAKELSEQNKEPFRKSLRGLQNLSEKHQH